MKKAKSVKNQYTSICMNIENRRIFSNEEMKQFRKEAKLKKVLKKVRKQNKK